MYTILDQKARRKFDYLRVTKFNSVKKFEFISLFSGLLYEDDFELNVSLLFKFTKSKKKKKKIRNL